MHADLGLEVVQPLLRLDVDRGGFEVAPGHFRRRPDGRRRRSRHGVPRCARRTAHDPFHDDREVWASKPHAAARPRAEGAGTARSDRALSQNGYGGT
eukprot:6494834-Pyramimonas_sp.AAC.1